MSDKNISPKTYQAFKENWRDQMKRQAGLDAYTSGANSFIPNLLPEDALSLSAGETLNILRERFGGDTVNAALQAVDNGTQPPSAPRSPVANQPNGDWLRNANMVGINVRTVGSFWNIIKYALTLPNFQDSIHLLPIWEPGVVGSMYGISSWHLNPEFFSAELAAAIPALDTIEKQLAAVVNLLHLMGKSVGMDVIPHTDRFSQIALAFPEHFEWLQRRDIEITDHRANLHEDVQKVILEFLRENGAALEGDLVPDGFFALDEDARMRLLFGDPADKGARDARRRKLINKLYQHGYEPVPATMAPPFRGLAVDPREEARNVDGDGQVWRDFVITEPEPMSRVFGPLGRYKLYESKDDNANWELDFSQPRTETWEYVCERYAQVQQRFGFDFMRGDMSHVQMRKDGVPAELDEYYDILGAVKNHIQAQGAPYFGYFAETFIGPPNIFGYGDEMDHLEAAQAETTLGDLQSTIVGSIEFLQRFRAYDDMRETRLCTPNFTVMTADKDDPRFDEFYVAGNEVRLFIALFLTAMPSYMGLGFESRDTHHEPAPNEHYTKLYVFQESDGPKATHGAYVWGKNGELFSHITRLRLYAEEILPNIATRPTRWLIAPDAMAYNRIIAWTQADNPQYLFLANVDTWRGYSRFGIPQIDGVANPVSLSATFSTASPTPDKAPLLFNGKHYLVDEIAAGEGRVYRIMT